jgi:hypothetical protein
MVPKSGSLTGRRLANAQSLGAQEWQLVDIEKVTISLTHLLALIKLCKSLKNKIQRC